MILRMMQTRSRVSNHFHHIVAEVARKSSTKQSVVRLILSEYARIVARELLKGNLITFPYAFGYCEIISRKMTRSTILYLQINKKKIDNYFYKTGFFFKVKDLYLNDLEIYATGTIVDRLRHIVSNNLKQYRYVD